MGNGILLLEIPLYVIYEEKRLSLIIQPSSGQKKPPIIRLRDKCVVYNENAISEANGAARSGEKE